MTALLRNSQIDTAVGNQLHQFASQLFPICRSITGDGLRQTLGMIGERIPLQMVEVPSGMRAFDWQIPAEWNVRDAYIADTNGVRLIDFKKCNLHVVNYSIPVHMVLRFDELRQHLFTIPERPDWIPYRTTYYKEEWGFCLSHNQLLALDPNAEYEVCIDSSLSDGSLTFGECYLPGRTESEILISCHVCHPSLANDNLSGAAVATFLAEYLSRRDTRYSYRFIFAPGTIGAIAWLSRNQENVGRIRHGLVLTCVGDDGGFHYKKSRRGDAEIDRVASFVLKNEAGAAEILDFSPYGYDERQYCSPGFNLPVGCLMRSVWGTFPQYHTSADNLDFIRPECLADSLAICTSIVETLEGNLRYVNLSPYCEPQLGRRNLYHTMGGCGLENEIHARLWVLNLSDGQHSLLDIAERSGMSFGVIREAADLLCGAGLLARATESDDTQSREAILFNAGGSTQTPSRAN